MKFHTTTENLSQMHENSYISEEIDSSLASKQKKIQKAAFKNGKPCIRWSFSENLLYLKYIKMNSKKLTQNKSKKKYKKFQKMSQFIQQKNADQCRSHHQKMLMRFGSIDNIVTKLSNELKQSYYQTSSQAQTKFQVCLGELQVEIANNDEQQNKSQAQMTNQLKQSESYEERVHWSEQDVFDVVDF